MRALWVLELHRCRWSSLIFDSFNKLIVRFINNFWRRSKVRRMPMLRNFAICLIRMSTASLLPLILNVRDNTLNWESGMNIHRSTKRAEREKFRKRRKSFFKKANEFSSLCHTDLYFVMYQNVKYYIYSSTDREACFSNEKNLIWRVYRCMKNSLTYSSI